MSKFRVHFLILLAALLYAQPAASQAGGPQPSASADAPAEVFRHPTEVSEQFLPSQGAGPRFETGTKTSTMAQLAIQQERVLSVPFFSDAFTFEDKRFPFTMVGHAPKSGVTARVKTQLIAISMFFEGYVDNAGDPIILDVSSVVPQVVNSPNFRQSSYRTGFTQFGDAVQRAEFFHSMNSDWHTLLRPPEMLTPLTIYVPRGSATLYRIPSGKVFAVVDTAFFISHLNTIIQTENLDISALPIALTTNVLLAPGGKIQTCCVLGFHTAFDTGISGDSVQVQTFLWASWMDAGIFGGTLADVTPLSHEIQEWMNNPFGVNLVPAWTFPNGVGGCQDNLETGDPIAVFANSGSPVTIDGFTYHPQSHALLQWFRRNEQSDAVDGVFSFPDGTLLTGPAQSCPAR